MHYANEHHATNTKIIMSVQEFITACGAGDESEVKSMVERDPGLYNKQENRYGRTGLIVALNDKQHSLSRWLLSLPGLDTSLRNRINCTALHRACWHKAPLDIVITLVRLSSWENISRADKVELAERQNRELDDLNKSHLFEKEKKEFEKTKRKKRL